jgi:hypothetical protein
MAAAAITSENSYWNVQHTFYDHVGCRLRCLQLDGAVLYSDVQESFILLRNLQTKCPPGDVCCEIVDLEAVASDLDLTVRHQSELANSLELKRKEFDANYAVCCILQSLSDGSVRFHLVPTTLSDRSIGILLGVQVKLPLDGDGSERLAGTRCNLLDKTEADGACSIVDHIKNHSSFSLQLLDADGRISCNVPGRRGQLHAESAAWFDTMGFFPLDRVTSCLI